MSAPLRLACTFLTKSITFTMNATPLFLLFIEYDGTFAFCPRCTSKVVFIDDRLLVSVTVKVCGSVSGYTSKQHLLSSDSVLDIMWLFFPSSTSP
uniref:Putative secreted protein n=1 Tax=Anopheles darlingi TaxID=43151 RepID=A0A2M4D5F6_ANODA